MRFNVVTAGLNTRNWSHAWAMSLHAPNAKMRATSTNRCPPLRIIERRHQAAACPPPLTAKPAACHRVPEACARCSRGQVRINPRVPDIPRTGIGWFGKPIWGSEMTGCFAIVGKNPTVLSRIFETRLSRFAAEKVLLAHLLRRRSLGIVPN